MEILKNNFNIQYMHLALIQARYAWNLLEVPVGAVIVKNNVIIASGFNQSIRKCDPSAHAEIITLRNAAIKLKNYRLPGCTIYVTLEPCAMCAGAILHARLTCVVYGALDKKTGAAGSVINLFQQNQLNHHTKLIGGIMSKKCGDLLKNFFIYKRYIKNKI